MASCPSATGLGCEAASDQLPIERDISTAGFPRFADAMNLTITAVDFAPPRLPHPRPWQRIPVPASSSSLGLRMVWKRVGGIPLSYEDRRYFEGVLELRADGQGPRKTRRDSRHVPVWGDGQWKHFKALAMDNARGNLATAPEVAENLEGTALEITDSPSAVSRTEITGIFRQVPTFVSRKRNSRRQPLSASHRPPTTSETLQRLATAPDSSLAIPLDEPINMEENVENITTRLKRRMSRRISILPRREHDTESNRTHGMSPRTPTASTPQCLAPPNSSSSPARRRASISAIDGKQIPPATPITDIAPPLPSKAAIPSPVKTSPEKLSPQVNNLNFGQVALAVVFDQPIVEIEAASPQEIRRRVSMHNARRRETWLSAVEGQSPKVKNGSRYNRRHSFLPLQDRLVFSPTMTRNENRRHTLQPGAVDSLFSSPKFTPESDSLQTTGISAFKDTTITTEIRRLDESTIVDSPTPAQDETVVVDVRTNLDIFGSGPPVQTHHSLADHRISLSLNDCSKTPHQGAPASAAAGDDELARHEKPNAPASTPDSVHKKSKTLCTMLIDSSNSTDQPYESRDAENVNALSHDSPDEEDTLPFSNQRAPQNFNMDMDVSAEDSREDTDDECIVSNLPTSVQLDESLLLPLPETTETEDNWQSPTPAELDHPRDLLDTPQRCESIDLSISPPLFAHQGFNDEPTTEILIAEGTKTTGEALIMEHNFAAFSSDMGAGSDSPSPAPSVDEEYARNTLAAAIHILPEIVEDVTATMTIDLDNLAEEQLSAHEDSETEMLRKFVTRVKADKSAKAAAAAAAATTRPRINSRHKRRSGSTGSAASASGSPVSKKDGVLASPCESLERRVPLGKMDLNMSPSPKKKRKGSGRDFLGENRSRDLLSKPSLEDSSPPRPKRRRKKMEADTGGIFNPEFVPTREDSSSEPSGPRRSKRTRSNQTPLKPVGTTANNALSLIPVRLPVSLNLNGDDSYGLSTSSLNLRRNDDKDLAAVTRVNTRKNKGNADPPCIVVARESHEALRASREPKSVFDSPLPVQNMTSKTRTEDESHGKHRKPNKPFRSAKTVRWAEVLARYQSSDNDSPEKDAEDSISSRVDSLNNSNSASIGGSSGLLLPVEPHAPLAAEGESLKPAESESGPTANGPAAPTATQQGEPEKKSIPRRTTRVSRLQPPTPREVIASAAKSAAPATAVTDNAAMGLKSLSSGASAKRMATKRANVIGMGMAGNGTPAPKRRKTRTT